MIAAEAVGMEDRYVDIVERLPLGNARKCDSLKELLKDAYLNSLKLAVQKKLKSISFPSISTGAYRYPIDEAARIALSTVKEYLEQENILEEVNFVLFTEADLNTYQDAAKEIFGSK